MAESINYSHHWYIRRLSAAASDSSSIHSIGNCLDTSRLDSAQRAKTSKAAAIQQAARKSLTKLFRALSAFAFDCGLSVSEVNSLLRTAAVQTAAMRQLKHGSRVN